MGNAERLLIRPPPFHDESFYGYIFRLSEANYYDSPRRIIRSIGGRPGLDKAKQIPLDEQVGRLAALSGVAASRWYEMMFLTPSRLYGSERIVFGNVISNRHITLTSPKTCPRCLKEKGYFSQMWGLTFVTVCPIHGVELVERCPRCSKKLSWRRRLMNRCSCGQDLRNVGQTEVSQETGAFWRRVYEKCGLLPPMGANGSNILENLGLRDMLHAVISVANQYRYISTPRGDLLQSVASSDITANIARAYQVFNNWPANFNAFLDWHGKQPQKRHPACLDNYRDFGVQLPALSEKLAGISKKFLTA